MQTFEATESAIGGQTAQGFGRVRMEYLQHPETLNQAATLYENYLAEHAERLRDGLLDGTLGTTAPAKTAPKEEEG